MYACNTSVGITACVSFPFCHKTDWLATLYLHFAGNSLSTLCAVLIWQPVHFHFQHRKVWWCANLDAFSRQFLFSCVDYLFWLNFRYKRNNNFVKKERRLNYEIRKLNSNRLTVNELSFHLISSNWTIYTK